VHHFFDFSLENLNPLGSGAFGVVVLAVRRSVGAVVALKLVYLSGRNRGRRLKTTNEGEIAILMRVNAMRHDHLSGLLEAWIKPTELYAEALIRLSDNHQREEGQLLLCFELPAFPVSHYLIRIPGDARAGLPGADLVD
jgi:serine/threonine protein kinase